VTNWLRRLLGAADDKSYEEVVVTQERRQQDQLKEWRLTLTEVRRVQAQVGRKVER
jgi:hypothetical protein